MVIEHDTTTELREVEVTTFVLRLSAEEMRQLTCALLWTQPDDDNEPDDLWLLFSDAIQAAGIEHVDDVNYASLRKKS